MTFQYKYVGSPLGQILIAASDDGIKGLWFENQRHHPDITCWQAVRSQKWLDPRWPVKFPHLWPGQTPPPERAVN